MRIEEAIKGRRSIGRVKPDPVDKSLIEKLLEAAVWAPNHYKTEPWRFFVMTGEGRNRLAGAYKEIAREEAEAAGTPVSEEQLRKHWDKAFRAPVIIAVAASPTSMPKVHWIEEMAAVHAAVQNMLLTAHSLGLGAIWRSGDPMYHPRMKQAFGLEEHEEVAGLIYLGYPENGQPPAPAKTSFAQRTIWYE
ncbi:MULTISPECIES: nitroreductase family protein [unclassified Paenibacillus]|jgi:nitroreductase|uniref:nitroreductase family protein n=1 Tax=unclassified Paenibacillus TaxID=185978 RepID=UPI0011A8D115|nr:MULTISPECIES: nitroreductase [Paenibacillaceae]